jgi:crossover junction endodeoxyribonuclease RuvC
VARVRKQLLLGVDPGLASTGYGLLAADQSVVGWGTFRTRPGPAGPRLLDLVRQVEALLAANPVDEAAMEEIFMGRNRTSVIGVAQARGAILATLEAHGVVTHEYKPSQVKSVVTGYGMAGKQQMARMLSAQVETLGRPDEHAVDALAIALCHARSRRLRMVATR